MSERKLREYWTCDSAIGDGAIIESEICPFHVAFSPFKVIHKDDHDQIVSYFNKKYDELLLRTQILISEIEKVLPRQPSMDGKESWSQCQRIIDRAINDYRGD